MRRSRYNPDASDTATELAAESVKAMGKRAAAKGAIETAAKLGGKAIPGVGEALIAYEGSRSAVRDMRGLHKKGKEVQKAAWAAAKAGKFVEAGGELSRWGQHVGKETALMGPRTLAAGLTTAEVAERFIPRSNPERTEPPPGFEIQFWEGDWEIYDRAHDWTIGQLFESKDVAIVEAWRIFDAEQKSIARRAKLAAIPGVRRGRGLVHAPKKFRSKKNPDSVTELKQSGLLARLVGTRVLYQQLHWNAKSYGNHLLFERLYKSLDESIDALAELLLAYGGELAGSAITPVSSGHPAEDETWLISKAQSFSGKVPADIDNFLMNLMQERRRAIYLLRQVGA